MRRPALLLLVVALLVMTFLPPESMMMTAVPAYGLTPPPADQPLMPEFSQVFGVGSGAPAQCSNHGVPFACSFGSNRNYFFNANGTNLINATTTMSLSGPLDGVGVGGGNWSYQMNMYSPAAFTVASYMQCVLTNNGPEVNAQDYWVAANDFVPIRASSQTLTSIPQSEYVSGFSMRIEAVTNSTGYVVGCQYNANAANGASLMNEYVPLSKGVLNSGAPAGEAWQNYSAPTVGFEIHLIGPYNAETANFSRASGTLTNTASTPMGWTATDPDTFSWVSYKGSGTVEKSNIGYFEPALLAAPIPSTSTKTTTETATVTVTIVSTASPETITQTETTTMPATTAALTNSQIITQTVTSTTSLTSSSVPIWAYVTMSILLIAGIATGYVVKRRPAGKW